MEENLINWFSCLIKCGLYTATTQLQQISSSYYWRSHCAVTKLVPKCLRNQQWKRIQRFTHLIMLNWSDQIILNIQPSKESKTLSEFTLKSFKLRLKGSISPHWIKQSHLLDVKFFYIKYKVLYCAVISSQSSILNEIRNNNFFKHLRELNSFLKSSSLVFSAHT